MTFLACVRFSTFLATKQFGAREMVPLGPEKGKPTEAGQVHPGRKIKDEAYNPKSKSGARHEAARWRVRAALVGYYRWGSGCALKTSRVSCCLSTLSSSSAPTSLSSSIIPISGRIYCWVRSKSCSPALACTKRAVVEPRRLIMISPPCVLRPRTLEGRIGGHV